LLTCVVYGAEVMSHTLELCFEVL